MRQVEKFLGLPKDDYSQMHERVHQKKPVQIPDAVISQIERRLEGQDAFLEAEFGPDCARTTE